MRQKQLSAPIGDIYDAAFDPPLSVDVLGKTRSFIGGHAANAVTVPRLRVYAVWQDCAT
jgi:hypothetical protein